MKVRTLSTADLCSLVLAITAGLAHVAIAAEPPDWIRFRGPNCDGKCTETGLLQQWPEGGPELLWKIEGLGKGYSSTSIAGGKLFTMGDREIDGAESQFIIAYNLTTREELWATRIGPPHSDGPRCTPTIDAGLLFAIGTSGDLLCVDAATGQVRWKKNFEADFGGRMMTGWRYSESPLVDGDKLVCTPGGKDATVVALDKTTGELIWKCGLPEIGGRGKDGAGYASMIVAEIGGVRQYVQILGRGAAGVEAESGKFLWGYNRIANGIANIPTPIARGNHVFVTTSYKTGSALLELTRNGDGFDAEEVYFLGHKDFENHHGGVVLIGDYLYGGDGQNNGTPVCLNMLTGEIAWKPKAPSKGSAALLYADGRLIFRYDTGLVVLVEATPEEFRIKGQFQQPSRSAKKAWPHPVIHDGKLYLRDWDVLLCYDVGGEK